MASRIIAEFSSPYDELLGICPWVTNVSREWVHNDTGTATFSLAGTTPNLAAYLADGNIVRLHEEGVPTWIGLVVEQSWVGGNVTVGLLSAEWLLTGRITKQGISLGSSGGATAGYIAQALFTSAVSQSSLIKNLKPGTFDATPKHFKQYDYVDLFDAFSDMAASDGSAFWVDTNLRVNYRNLRGSDLTAGSTPVILFENTQLVDVRVTRRISNVTTAVVALGEGSSIPAKPKYGAAKPHPRLVRAKVLNLSGITSAAGLVGPTQQQLNAEIEPELLVDCTMSRYDERPATGRVQFPEWGRFWMGDVVTVVLYSMPSVIEMRALVIGVSIEEEDTLRLVLKLIPQMNTLPFISWYPG